mmetsp:Transcript_17572/g.19895  ORF Transcript_17572/g.19895 Transcript_17572/m.19895 type:complete len:83 (+) Transcript_17572:102-350(+)
MVRTDTLFTYRSEENTNQQERGERTERRSFRKVYIKTLSTRRWIAFRVEKRKKMNRESFHKQRACGCEGCYFNRLLSESRDA